MSGVRFGPALALIVLVHLALAGSVLVSCWGHLLDVEERYIAFAAGELLRGPRVSWTLLGYTPYEAGTLLVAILAVPFVAVLGSTALALKLPGLLLSAATVALTGLIGRRWWDDRTGLVAAALLAVGPPALLVGAAQTLGDSTEVLPLLLLTLLLACQTDRPRRLAAAGLVAGLALTWSLAAAPALAALALVLALERLPRRAWLALLLGGLVGSALLTWNLAVHRVPFFLVRGRAVALDASPAAWWTFLWPVDPEAFHHRLPIAPWLSIQRGYTLLVTLGWLALLPAVRTTDDGARPTRRLLLWHLAYLAAFALSPYREGYLLALLAPSTALILARLAARLPLGRELAGLLLLLLLLPLGGLLGSAGTPLPSAPAEPRPDEWAWRLHGYDVDARARAALSPDERFAIGWHLAEMRPGLPELRARLTGVGAPAVRATLRGYGFGLAWVGRPDHSDLRELGASASFGFGRGVGERFWHLDPDRPERLLRHVPTRARRAYFEGLGYGLGWRFWHHPDRYRRWLLAVPDGDWPALRTGLERRLAELTDDRARAAWLSELRRGPGGAMTLDLPVARRSGGSLTLLGDDAGFSAGLAVDQGARPAWIAWRVPVHAPGRYVLHLQLAHPAAHPLTIGVDGQPTTTTSPATGGERRADLRWFPAGELTLAAGIRVLRIEGRDGFPHLAGARLVRVLD